MSKIKIAATTDVGKERSNNEDAYIFCPDISKQDWTGQEATSYIPLSENGAVVVVADGMGGTNAGEVASAIATNTIKDSFTCENVARLRADSKSIPAFLTACIEKADKTIIQKTYDNPDTLGMGTTIVVCWVLGQKAYIAWCGDSRCYLYRPQEGLKQLTKDHSLVQEMVDKGEITEEEAFTHPDSNIITRSLGDTDSLATPDVMDYDIKPGDTILLCSDGLCGYCTDQQIEAVCARYYADVTQCRDELLKCALDMGGYDNICIALASFIADDQTAPSRPSSGQGILQFFKRFLNLG